ncbi:hypothetical protein BV25DRAFT_1987669 [Artomyces pyxidatus]|uniref:Uncharacterized protein n=1 Tax=Artomyces pyxidatus TaxID=48021 RepID=A0ACB8TFQ8_9AGAM|nr:hypothetical protein BV25DRAFT_1987669 [Artomyces pyxidatus]
MSDPALFGRNRQSIAAIDQELHDIFREHPECSINPQGLPSLRAKYLTDVFETYRQEYGLELISAAEMEKLMEVLDTTHDLPVTPDLILQFVAMRSSGSPKASPDNPSGNEEWERGRAEDREFGRHSRSSSNGSNGTYYQPSSSSRPPSRGPAPPKTPNMKESPFDVQKRQRTTPLGAVAPSSWSKRPVAPSRRKSDAGHNRSVSDSESVTAGPSAFGRSAGRTRAPSNPTTPGLSPTSSVSAIGSPPLGESISRPHSRTQSQPQTQFIYGSTPNSPPGHSPARLDLSKAMYDSFDDAVSSLPMPHTSDSDSDGEDSALGLVYDRSAASSTASLEPSERLEALQRANTELGKKLIEAERTLHRKLADHEMELEEMEARLEEARTELSAAKREEKELRNKERSNSTQIMMLETEIAKVQKTLDSSRAAYTSLQKQYTEQLNESEDLRNIVRRKDEEIKDYREASALQAIENHKWIKEHDTYEERISFLEQELAIAQQAQATLDEQKQENLMLKETIDRMRFDMDELRNGLSSNAGGIGSGNSSAQNSVSKSLGAELLSRMRTGGSWMDDEEEDEEPNRILNDLDIEGQDEDTEGEDVIQTIITRKKRRGTSRANKLEPITIEDTREYVNAYTQYDLASHTSTLATQTDPEPKPITAFSSNQTDDVLTLSLEIQTDPPLPKLTVDMEVQTEEARSRSPTPEDDDALASSSSTVLPPTPKAKPMPLDLLSSPADLPPSYHQVASEALFPDLEHVLEHEDLTFSHIEDPQTRRDLRIAADTLRKWHKGVHAPLRASTGGVSEEAVEEWRALKEELGLDCMVIDKVIATSPRLENHRAPKDGNRRRSRFYNIYNTYVYGAGGEGGPASGGPWGNVASQALLCIGASAAVFFAMSPFLAHQYVVPGGPTYYDRAAWTSFNTMHAAGEGFSHDGTAAVWNFLGRVGGGAAARIVRGWPT